MECSSWLSCRVVPIHETGPAERGVGAEPGFPCMVGRPVLVRRIRPSGTGRDGAGRPGRFFGGAEPGECAGRVPSRTVSLRLSGPRRSDVVDARHGGQVSVRRSRRSAGASTSTSAPSLRIEATARSMDSIGMVTWIQPPESAAVAVSRGLDDGPVHEVGQARQSVGREPDGRRVLVAALVEGLQVGLPVFGQHELLRSCELFLQDLEVEDAGDAVGTNPSLRPGDQVPVSCLENQPQRLHRPSDLVRLSPTEVLVTEEAGA